MLKEDTLDDQAASAWQTSLRQSCTVSRLGCEERNEMQIFHCGSSWASEPWTLLQSTVVMLLTQKLRTPASSPSVHQYKLAHWSMSSLNLLRIALQILLYARVSSGLLTFILGWREHFHHWTNPESVYMLGAGRIFLLPTTLFCLLLEHVFAARHRICL